MHKADEYAKNADTKGIERINYLGMLTLFIFYAIIAFLPVYFGAELAQRVVEFMPTWLIEGLGVAGGMMPAIGFAMLLKIMLMKEYAAFLIVGFVLVAYFGLPILGVSLLGLSVAMYDFYANKARQVQTSRRGGRTDGI